MIADGCTADTRTQKLGKLDDEAWSVARAISDKTECIPGWNADDAWDWLCSDASNIIRQMERVKYRLDNHTAKEAWPLDDGEDSTTITDAATSERIEDAKCIVYGDATTLHIAVWVLHNEAKSARLKDQHKGATDMHTSFASLWN